MVVVQEIRDFRRVKGRLEFLTKSTKASYSWLPQTQLASCQCHLQPFSNFYITLPTLSGRVLNHFVSVFVRSNARSLSNSEKILLINAGIALGIAVAKFSQTRNKNIYLSFLGQSASRIWCHRVRFGLPPCNSVGAKQFINPALWCPLCDFFFCISLKPSGLLLHLFRLSAISSSSFPVGRD